MGCFLMQKLVSAIHADILFPLFMTTCCLFMREAQFIKGETAERQERRSKGGRAQPPPSLFFLRFPPKSCERSEAILLAPILTIFSLPAALCSSISYALTELIIVTEARLIESDLFKDSSAIR